MRKEIKGTVLELDNDIPPASGDEGSAGGSLGPSSGAVSGADSAAAGGSASGLLLLLFWSLGVVRGSEEDAAVTG